MATSGGRLPASQPVTRQKPGGTLADVMSMK